MHRSRKILFFSDRQYALNNASDKVVAFSQIKQAPLTVLDVTSEVGLSDVVARTLAIDINKQPGEQGPQKQDALTLSAMFNGNTAEAALHIRPSRC